LFLGISVIWGSSFLLIAMGLDTLTAGAVTFLRVGLGAVTLWLVRVYRLVSGRRPASARSFGGDPIIRGDWPLIVFVSFVWVAVPFTLFPLAQQHINSAITGLLNGATPVFVAVVSVVLTRVVPSRRQLVGIAIGFIGLVLLSLPSINDGQSQARGVALVLLATVCYGVAINVAAPLQRRYGAITLMSWVLGLATIWLIPIGGRGLGDNVWAARSLVPVLVLGVVGTGAAYWIMSTLVGRVGSIRGSLITYLIPVVSLILGVLVRSDQVAPLALVGAVLITVGALLASRRTP
jgi:drug/metabolite transporter (DMT)-like permease